MAHRPPRPCPPGRVTPPRSAAPPCYNRAAVVRIPVPILAASRSGSLVPVVLAALLAWSACAPVAPEMTRERRAQALDKSLICPICPGETIDQSQVALAKQMQVVVRDMLAEGSAEREIQDFFVERYGESVLAAPRKEGFNLIVWAVPPLGMAAGLVALYFVVRAMSRRPGQGGATPVLAGDEVSVDHGLAPYLEMVDRDMGDVGGAASGGSSGG